MDNYYDRIADLYDTTRSLPPEIEQQVTRFILNLVSAHPSSRFLEPGIGTGLIAIPIIKQGYAYTGIDISAEMMAQIEHKLGSLPENLTLIQADAAALDFADATFDVVLMRHFIHLVPDWRLALCEIQRVLKPQGFLLYCESPWSPHQQEFEQHWRSFLNQYDCFQPPGCEDRDRANLDKVKTWLTERGATVEIAIAAQWPIQETVGDRLTLYATRDHATCWSISDEVFPEAIAAFKTWCINHYGSTETVLSSEGRFSIVYARKDD
ncbi:MAG: class I SAM-dependent methyltransferase [Oculatellaceae cyanobacterium Prado106]|jgi:ubiquinone/menaquinone biosynthesis C-methylase UbiE|nr:class I SAM-dependent methyltransferase [Oculatellaceae cyanobacterium Prado106]